MYNFSHNVLQDPLLYNFILSLNAKTLFWAFAPLCLLRHLYVLFGSSPRPRRVTQRESLEAARRVTDIGAVVSRIGVPFKGSFEGV